MASSHDLSPVSQRIGPSSMMCLWAVDNSVSPTWTVRRFLLCFSVELLTSHACVCGPHVGSPCSWEDLPFIQKLLLRGNALLISKSGRGLGWRSLFAHIFKPTVFWGCQQACFNLLPTKAGLLLLFPRPRGKSVCLWCHAGR